jgi:type IV fimbrial biogenesis protein FimT
VGEKGFTLMEMLVTIGLVSVLASISFFSSRGLMDGYRIRGAAREVFADMQMARLGAIKEGTNWALCFSPGTAFTSYTLRNAAGADRNLCTNDDPTPYRKSVDIANLYSGMSYAANFSAATKIEFTPRGTVASGNVTITKGSRNLLVTTNGSTGNIRIQ